MFIEACYKFIDHLRAVKNASEHTIRNYTIDLNTLKQFIEKDLYPDAKVEDLPDKIFYDQMYDVRFKGKDQLTA